MKKSVFKFIIDSIFFSSSFFFLQLPLSNWTSSTLLRTRNFNFSLNNKSIVVATAQVAGQTSVNELAKKSGCRPKSAKKEKKRKKENIRDNLPRAGSTREKSDFRRQTLVLSSPSGKVLRWGERGVKRNAKTWKNEGMKPRARGRV